MGQSRLWFIGGCLAVWFCFPQGVPILLAQDQGMTSVQCALAACIQMALERHPDMQASAAKKLAASSKMAFEKAQWWPQLTAIGKSGYVEGTASLAEEGLRGQDISAGFVEGSVIVTTPLIKGGKIVGQETPLVEQARYELSRTESLHSVRRDQITYNVTTAYLTVLKTTQSVTYQEQVLQVAEELYRGAQARFAQDLIARNELLIAEVQLASAKRDLLLSQHAVAQANRRLARAMGLEVMATVDRLDPQPLPLQVVPLPPLAALVSFAFEHRPELQAQQAQVHAKEAEVKQSQGERLPALDLNARYRALDNFEGLDRQWRVLAVLTVPLWDFGRTSHKVEFARAIVAEESQKRDSFKIQIMGEVQDVYSKLLDLKAQLELLDTQIEQAQEALKLNQAKFAQQLLPPSAVAEAQIALVKLEQTKTLARYDLALTYRQLELVTAGWQGTTP